MSDRSLIHLAAGLLLSGAVSIPARAQSPENVAVVINDASPASVRIGEYYVRKRAVPADNVIRIKTATDEELSRVAFEATIERPIAAAITRAGLQDRILYLVLTKGVPLRVTGTPGLQGTVASVDSELTLLYRRLTGAAPHPPMGTVDNPYYLGDGSVKEAQRFTHRAHDIFLVSRLDAFTVEDALGLIDRGIEPLDAGRIVLDQRARPADALGDRWLAQAAANLRDLGFATRVVLEDTPGSVRGARPVLGYYSWGSNDPSNRQRTFKMGFVPGALAATYASTDARTFREPPKGWVPGMPWGKGGSYQASVHTLVGDLIREGATGVAGHVAEPYFQSTVRPQILFPAYLTGFNLIEAFYLAIPHLSWQTVVIGDPLCAPFARPTLTRADIEDPVDPQTEMPGLFGGRRLEAAQRAAKDAAPAAVQFLLLAETRTARGDAAGTRQALEQSTALAPTLAGAQLQLALLYDQAKEYERAAERYRVLLEAYPDNAVVLNNLAYVLAERLNAPAEAKPLAERASALAPDDPNVIDTRAWIEHLLGNHGDAAKLIAKAAAAAPGNAELRLHAAFIYAAMKNGPAAAEELEAALKIDPDLARRDDVRELRTRIGGKGV